MRLSTCGQQTLRWSPIYRMQLEHECCCQVSRMTSLSLVSSTNFTGMHSAEFGNGSLRAIHQRLVTDGRRLTSPLLVSELTSATGTGAALASFQEQIAITLLHRDQDFATVTCVTGISSAGANVSMYKSSSPLVGGTQLMFYTISSSCADNVGIFNCQAGHSYVAGSDCYAEQEPEPLVPTTLADALPAQKRQKTLTKFNSWSSAASVVLASV